MPQDPKSRRERESRRYRPKEITLLLVAEAPPCSEERYFYFDDVREHDWLFRYVIKGLFGITPPRNEKAAYLARLKDHGVFLIDLSTTPVDKGQKLDEFVPDLVERCAALKPRHIILIKSGVYDLAYEPLKARGLTVIDERMPFPTSGQQQRFEVGFARALDDAGWKRPRPSS